MGAKKGQTLRGRKLSLTWNESRKRHLGSKSLSGIRNQGITISTLEVNPQVKL
jgi:hypothetical protein